MDLHTGLNRTVLASCLALYAAGCAMSAVPASNDAGRSTSARNASRAPQGPAAADQFEGDWYYGSDCDFGHYVSLGLKRSGRGYVGEWSDGTKVHGSDGRLRATPHGTKLQLAICGQEARSGFPVCPKYEDTTDVLELRGDHLVWRQGTGSYAHDYAVMHRQIGDKAEIERCTDDDASDKDDDQ